MAEKKETLAPKPGAFNIAEMARAEGNASQRRAEDWLGRVVSGRGAEHPGGTHNADKNAVNAAHRAAADLGKETGRHAGAQPGGGKPSDLTTYLAQGEGKARKGETLAKRRTKGPQAGKGKR